jgi:hypothetical protein
MVSRWRRIDTGRRWALASLLLAVVVSAGFLVVPVHESGCMDDAFAGDGSCTSGNTRTTLLEEEGSRILWIAAVPVVLAAVGALLRWHVARLFVAVALGAFVVLGAFSIGGSYIPSAVAMAIAARKSRDSPTRAGQMSRQTIARLLAEQPPPRPRRSATRGFDD